MTRAYIPPVEGRALKRDTPPLDGFAGRTCIAGVLPNTRENPVRWITKPRSVSPLMPDLGVTEAHAHDMAAYLESLR